MTTTQRNIAITIVRNQDDTTPASRFGMCISLFYALLITVTTPTVTSMFKSSDLCTTPQMQNLYIWSWFYTSTCIFECAYKLFVYLKLGENSKFKQFMRYLLWLVFIGKFVTFVFIAYTSNNVLGECITEPIYKLGIAYLWIYITTRIFLPTLVALLIGILICSALLCRPRSLVHIAERVNRHTGASDETLQSLNHQIYNPYTTRLDDTTCTICSEDYANGNNIIILSCAEGKHHYHKDCIERWLRINPTCPQCRAPVENGPLVADGRRAPVENGPLVADGRRAPVENGPPV